MMLWHKLSLLFGVLAAISYGAPFPPSGELSISPGNGTISLFERGSSPNEKSVIFRTDSRSPSLFHQEDGIWCKAQMNKVSKPDYSLLHHVAGNGKDEHSAKDSGFTSATSDFNVAVKWSQIYNNNHKPCYIYKIARDRNVVDVADTLREYYPASKRWEKEFAIIRGVPWGQVEGWYKRTYAPGHTTPSWDWEENYQYKKGYDNHKDAGFMPFLAGFPPNHPAWNKEPWYPYGKCPNHFHRRSLTDHSDSDLVERAQPHKGSSAASTAKKGKKKAAPKAGSTKKKAGSTKKKAGPAKKKAGSTKKKAGSSKKKGGKPTTKKAPTKAKTKCTAAQKKAGTCKANTKTIACSAAQKKAGKCPSSSKGKHCVAESPLQAATKLLKQFDAKRPH